MPVFKLSIKLHDGAERLFAAFDYNKDLNKIVRELRSTHEYN